MSVRYTVDQLLHLRNSPLVSKPDTLPPAIEWMGPPQDQNQRKALPSRPRSDDQSQLDSFTKRPSLFETHSGARKSATAREDIILGPPKVAFSSSSNVRNAGRGTQPKDKIETVTGDEHSGTLPDRARKFGGLEEKEGDRQDYRLGNRRRGGFDDSEDWHDRPRRRPDNDDNDRRPRRNGGDRWNTRDPKLAANGESEVKMEREEDGKFTSRREGQGRARFQQPWIRGDASQSTPTESNFKDMRPKDWRKDRGERSHASDWLQSTRNEEPEWMDSDLPGENSQQKTQADFEQWLKDEKTKSQQKEQKEPPVEPPEKKIDRPKLQAPADTGFFGNLGSSEALNQSSNGFFGLFPEKLATKEATPATTEGKEKEKLGKTRFRALFSPAAETQQSDPEPAHETPDFTKAPASAPIPQKNESPAITSEVADRDGFQRILQMLGGRSRNATPQAGVQEQEASGAQGQQRPISIGLTSPSHDTFPSSSTTNTRSRNSNGLEHSVPPGSPLGIPDTARKTPQAQNTDILLRLMKQNQINEGQQRDQFIGRDDERNRAPSNSALHQMLNSAPKASTQRDMPALPGYFNDPAIANLQPHRQETDDQRIPSEVPSHRPQSFDEGMMNNYLTTQHPNPARNGPSRPPQAQGQPLPAGIGRPPGLAHPSMHPPGWPAQHQHHMPPQQHPQGMPPMNAPPGIPNPPPRTMNQGPGPGPGPGFPPLMYSQGPPQPLPPQQQQPPNPYHPQRKFTGNSGGGPPQFPPGMAPPPPGFMGAGGGPPQGAPLGGMGRPPADGRGLMDLLAGATGRYR